MERRQKIFLCKWRENRIIISPYPILQKAGIPTSLYPDNAVYLFAPEGFWEQARYMLLAIIVLLFITYLLWIRLRLLKKERVLHDRELVLLEKYKALFTNMPLAYMETSVDL